MTKIIIYTFLFVLSTPALAADPIRIAAGAAPIENVLKPIKGDFEKGSSKLEIIKGTPRTVLELLDQGKADAAIIAFDFNEWMKASEKMGYTPKKDDYSKRVIGRDVLSIVAHPSVQGEKISVETLKEVLLGKVDSWSKTGMGSEKVQIVLSTEMPGLNSLIEEKILGGEKLKPHIKVDAKEVPDLRKKIGSTPGAIGWIPLGATKNQNEVNVLETGISIGRPITVLTKGKPSDDLEALLRMITKL